MGSVNKVILVGNLTRNPEMKQSEGKNPSVPLVWQPTDTGQTREEKSTKRQSSTGLWPGTN
jgi:single-stranded DNA-binding protein